MAEPDREFQRRLLATFREEADEHLQAIARGLEGIEQAAGDEARAPVVEQVFREAHSLKGAARAVGLRQVESVCQSLESLLARVKRGETAPDAAVIAQLRAGSGEVARLLRPASPPAGADAPRRTAGPAAETPREETVRVSLSQLDRLLLQAEELVPARWAAAYRSAETQGLCAELDRWRREHGKVQRAALALQRTADGGRVAAPILDFLQWSTEFCRGAGERLARTARAMDRDQRTLGTMVDSLQRETKFLLLRPFSSVTEAFPQLVQDICRQQGKDIALSVVGADIEIDRRILQEIKDSLIHLLRNSVDHGIEGPEARARAGKPARGTITVSIEQRNADKVAIVISDDGGGIDLRMVREAAVRSGLRTALQVEAMGDAEALDLIFQSGLSTSAGVTEVSGRGLGMAIVREKVERLGGDLTVESRPGRGTAMTMLLPLAMSTIRGVIVRVAARLFILPVTFVERVALAPADEVGTVGNRASVLMDGRAVSFVRLRDALGIAPASPREGDAEGGRVVVVAAADRRVAFEVDEVLGEQEVLLKSLGPLLVRVRNVGGAAVLPTGQLVPVLNAVDLLKSAVKTAVPSPPAEGREGGAPARKRILVVDDSITARTLLKGILETAGYAVRTAVDGAEAFTAVREESFDLVVSDVDMPRMNGFDLTARIRADRKLADLPVVLVTALESRQDRERGIDAGANAYVVKSSFEQASLLEIIQRYT